MLEKILLHVESVFPSSVAGVTQEAWDKNVPSLCEQISLLGDDLFAIAENQLSKRPFLESKSEVVTSIKPMLQICETRLRPKSDHYNTIIKLVARFLLQKIGVNQA